MIPANKPVKPNKPKGRKAAIRWGVVAVVVVAVAIAVGVVTSGGSGPKEVSLSSFRSDLTAGQVQSAVVYDGSGKTTATLVGGTKVVTHYDERYAADLTSQMLAAHVEVSAKKVTEAVWIRLLIDLLPFVLLIGAFVLIINLTGPGGRGAMAFGKSKARLHSKEQPTVTFADVAGAEEAIAELGEIKDFLADPARFQAMGAKIPRGVLLFGPPGTGKTLLARAVAGEAGVPFFSISGSDFVEMFVGVGASRVRDLFEQAKANSPSIIFMDEIDAVGRHRGAGLGGGHDEREQTLNQLLVEMDGFDVKSGIILIAATNRPDILDPALLRPGRFDRQIVVDRPDLNGRRAILEVHAEGKPLGDGIDLEVLARRTPGFTGADLANLMNEAALLSARFGRDRIGMVELEEAIDRVIAGPERKTRVMSEREKQVIAYHEAGHAMVGHSLAGADPVHKVSIVARGQALGWTLSLPTEDRYIVTRSELRDRLAVMMGGRTAEELVFGDPSTGAQNDIEQATEVARAMVTEYGMSDLLGPQKLGQGTTEVFLGRDFGHQANYSADLASVVDSEVRILIEGAHDRARHILTSLRPTLDRMASRLVEVETLDGAELDAILGPRPQWVDGARGKPTANGKATNGKATNGKVANGKATNGKATNGKATNGKATTRRASPQKPVRG